MNDVDVVVIGAGVIGLAVARALAVSGREVIVLEAADAVGTETSARNSEVIHAGIYYPKGSLKARLCVDGRRALYAYAAEKGFDARAVGKLIVATDHDQIATLATIAAAAAANGVDDLVTLDASDAHALEPQVACVGALFSPSTGIVDSHALMLALEGDLEAAGGRVVLQSPVLSGRRIDGGIELTVGGSDPMALTATTVINACGLTAPTLAARIDGIAVSTLPRAYFAKGNYFSLSGTRAPFRHLVYPVPEPGGLGVHATLDLGGQVRFGPDVEWVDGIDYSVDPRRGDRFYDAIRRYWPTLPDGALVPAYCGIRPKLGGADAAAADFVVQGPSENGVPGLWNLFGIESPGLTSSLALADLVSERVSSPVG